MEMHSQGRISVEKALKGLTYAAALTGLLSAARFVAFPYMAAAVLLLILAVRFDYGRRIAVPRMALNSVMVLVVAYSVLRITLSDPATPILEALMLLLMVKLAEEKKARDYFQAYALTTFLLAGSALLSLDILFLAYLFVLTFLIPLCMVLLTFHAEDPGMEMPVREFGVVATRSLFIPVIAIPLAALLFIILPRTSTPLLGFLSRGGAGVGFSDSVSLGDITSIQESNIAAFRAEMERVDDRLLYWRGIVLDRFEGTAWKRDDSHETEDRPFIPGGKRVTQTIYLEPYENSYLFALDKPLSVRHQGAVMARDLTTTAPKPVSSRIRYAVVSVPSDILPTAADPPPGRYLQLPEQGLDKIASLSRELAGDTREQTALAILRHLRGVAFTYSLEDLPKSKEPLDDFLFVSRKGNCEYFASAMAVMLRLQGIPARLVGGYRGGSYNEMGGYYLITQNSAHVWVEAFFSGRGWVRLDPTPAGPAVAGSGALRSIRLFMDTMTYYWNVMVITYDFQKQITLFSSIGRTLRRPSVDPAFFKETLPKALLVVFIVAGSVFIIGKTLRRRLNPVEELVNAFAGRMRRHGYRREPFEGLEEFAGRIGESALRAKALDIAVEIERHAYGGRPLVREVRQALKGRIREL